MSSLALILTGTKKQGNKTKGGRKPRDSKFFQIAHLLDNSVLPLLGRPTGQSPLCSNVQWIGCVRPLTQRQGALGTEEEQRECCIYV